MEYDGIMGVCPPSNPNLTPPPERAFCPLLPRPAVLPFLNLDLYQHGLRSLREPSAGCNS